MNKKNHGAGIIEVLVAIGIVGLVLAALAGLGNFALRMQSHIKKNLEAVNLAVEALEAAKLLKSENWDLVGALSWDSAYRFVLAGSPMKFSLADGQETVGIFSRQIVFSQVFRDADDNIVSSGGIPDPETVKAVASVSWNEKGRVYEIQLAHYLTNWQQ
jgi:type II secretory pathway pseudopilin PulG